jgi:hypothetical protein
LNGLAFDQNLSLVRLFQADELSEQDRFATAARSNDDKNFAGVDLEIDSVEHFMSVVALVEPVDGQSDTVLLGKSSSHLPAMLRHKPSPTIKPNATMATARMQAVSSTSISHGLLFIWQIIA